MADTLALTENLGRIELQMTALAVQTAATEARVTLGDANVQAVVVALETRLASSEKKLADALATVSTTMLSMQNTMAALTPAPETRPGSRRLLRLSPLLPMAAHS